MLFFAQNKFFENESFRNFSHSALEMNFSGDANHFYVYKSTGKAFFSRITHFIFRIKQIFRKRKYSKFFPLDLNFLGYANHFYAYKTTGKAFFSRITHFIFRIKQILRKRKYSKFF